MVLSVADCLKPSYFISYSRRDELLAKALRNALTADANTVWLDLDCIQVGDVWPSEVERGIRACDEIVLLLSDDSASSGVVAQELETAAEIGKVISPIVIAPLRGPIPPRLARVHRLDVSGHTTHRAVQEIIGHLAAPNVSSRPHLDVKRLACRGLYPTFGMEWIGAVNLQRAQTVTTELERLQPGYAPRSTIWLNAGLAACLAGDWDKGLSTLRAHARAANSFPAWYLLALHLPRRSLVLGTPAPVMREACHAINHALAIQRHPLALLAAIVLELGDNTLGTDQLEPRLVEFNTRLANVRPEPSEVIRLAWCLQPSFRVLGAFETWTRATLKEISR